MRKLATCGSGVTGRRTARRLLAIWAACVLWPFGAAVARDPPVQEDLLKAAVVFKLTRYVDWPDATFDSDEGETLQLCVIGRSSVVDALETVDGRISKGVVVAYVKLATQDPADSCHVLFVADRTFDVRSLVDAEASAAAGRDVPGPVLTVSDVPAFVDRGGIVELTRRGTRLGFRISVENARSAGLVISAPLLELAEIVE